MKITFLSATGGTSLQIELSLKNFTLGKLCPKNAAYGIFRALCFLNPTKRSFSYEKVWENRRAHCGCGTGTRFCFLQG